MMHVKCIFGKDYTFFYLSAQWPASYCDSRGITCALTRPRNKNFTILGLWPQNAGGPVEYCNGEAYTLDKVSKSCQFSLNR
ncbi:hypothetical protein Tsubulata_050673 [Turnera subulata]|uniref:Uncharacterized protein n=1 Tax=Turnera subulata TaxID=218843 RepID=A0A9Q0FAB5_9ROSI|nr:hypothetical protein Tsubulata_050673 [Turnera subulata]